MEVLTYSPFKVEFVITCSFRLKVQVSFMQNPSENKHQRRHTRSEPPPTSPEAHPSVELTARAEGGWIFFYRRFKVAPHPPALLLHQLGDNNRIRNEGMRHRLHSPIKAAQRSLNTPSNDPP